MCLKDKMKKISVSATKLTEFPSNRNFKSLFKKYIIILCLHKKFNCIDNKRVTDAAYERQKKKYRLLNFEHVLKICIQVNNI